MLRKSQNVFSNLLDYQTDEIDISISTQHIQRKAEKKLREIEKLRYKENPTADEIDKISKEKYWFSMLYFDGIIYEETSNKRSNKLLKRDKERAAKKQRLELLREQQEAERLKREQEKELIERQKTILGSFYDINIARTILNEFDSFKTNKLAFHSLSLKYHPDRNHTKDATLHQQILCHIYEMSNNVTE